MDKLYNSADFYKDARNHPKCAMVSVIMRKGLHGLPTFIVKDECTTPIAASQYHVTLKSTVLKNDPECKGLISVSVYDIKPVHLLSISSDSLEWTNKYHMVYFNVQKNMLRLYFLRLNINDD